VGDQIKKKEIGGTDGTYGDRKGTYRVSVGRPDGKRLLGRPRHRWEDTTKMNLQGVGWRGMDWIPLAQGRDSLRALVNVVMSFWVPQNAGNLLTS
jgi:hypothetical protein